jgi:hypothetical protein
MDTHDKATTAKIISVSIIFLLAFSFVINHGSVKGQVKFQYFLPIILNEKATLEPTPEPTQEPTQEPPDPLPGKNEQCSSYGDAEICASVSNAAPKQNTNVTVYGRLIINGWAQPEKQMFTTWNYKTTSPTCNDGITNNDGIASCTRGIGRASIGYTVNIKVTIDGYEVTTSFTPID